MRFLYGDSTPFPLGYNVLTTLEAFMASATRIVELDGEARALARQVAEGAEARQRGLEALEGFHNVVMRAVTDTAQKVQHAHVLDYAARISESASAYVEEHQRTAAAASEQETLHLRAENERRVAQQRAALERFLKATRLPVLATRVSMRLAHEGKDGGYQATATYDHPDGIQTSFALAPARATGWAHPRRVSELAENLELMVGLDKSWLRGTVTPKQVALGDWVVFAFDASEDNFELVLRRRPGDKEQLSFRVRRCEGGLSGVFEGAGQPGEQPPGTLAPQDVAHLERLWLALRTVTRDVLEEKEQLVSVSLDGQLVFEAGLILPLVVRLVNLFAPTVREIAKRSPNEFELSLKLEDDDGRREELYLRREQLTGQVQPLSAQGRAVFAPLGLDTWVPGTTMTPPPVVPSPAPSVSGRPGPGSVPPPGSPLASPSGLVQPALASAASVGQASSPPGSPSGSPPPDVPVASGSNRVLSGS